MKKRNLKRLEVDGLLNRVEPDLGDLAAAKVPHKAVGSCGCCGHVEDDKDKTQCPRCDHALYWERIPESVALNKLYEAKFKSSGEAPVGSGMPRSGSDRFAFA